MKGQVCWGAAACGCLNVFCCVSFGGEPVPKLSWLTFQCLHVWADMYCNWNLHLGNGGPYRLSFLLSRCAPFGVSGAIRDWLTVLTHDMSTQSTSPEWRPVNVPYADSTNCCFEEDLGACVVVHESWCQELSLGCWMITFGRPNWNNVVHTV